MDKGSILKKLLRVQIKESKPLYPLSQGNAE